jgi:hypothetical protein
MIRYFYQHGIQTSTKRKKDVGYTKKQVKGGEVKYYNAKGERITKPDIPAFIPTRTPTRTDPSTGMQVPDTTGKIKKTSKITQPKQELSTIEKVAKVGLLPAAAGAKLLSKTDLSIGEIAEQTARTGAGKALGVGTVAAGAVLTGVAAAKLLVGGTMAAKSGTAVITREATHLHTGLTMTTQRAFQTLGGSKIAMFQKSIGKMSVPVVKKLLTSKGFVKIGAGIAGTDAIMAWLASDNIMSGISIHMRDLQFAVKNGAVSKEEALEEIQAQQEWKDYAEGFVKISSKVNPVLWPFGKLLLINAKKTQLDIDLQTQNIIMAGLT